MYDYAAILKGSDLRSIGKGNCLITLITSQKEFDQLFALLFHRERVIVMSAADTIEKVTKSQYDYLKRHKKALIGLCSTVSNKELKWHLAILVTRLNLSKSELNKVWQMLTTWARNQTESKIVRVNALQGLFNLLKGRTALQQDFMLTVAQVEKEGIPSINARLKQFRIQ